MTAKLMKDGSSTTKLGFAADWLRRLLADGPRRVEDVKEAAREAGIEPRTLRRAKELLGVESVLMQPLVLYDGPYRGEWQLEDGRPVGALATHAEALARRREVRAELHPGTRVWRLPEPDEERRSRALLWRPLPGPDETGTALWPMPKLLTKPGPGCCKQVHCIHKPGQCPSVVFPRVPRGRGH